MEKIILSESTCRLITWILSLVIIFIGVIGTLGWIFDIQMFKSIYPHWKTMEVNTAISIIMLGVGLYLMRDRQPDKFNQYAAFICATIVLLISGLTLYEYLFNADLGIDQWVYVDTQSNHLPGRMAFSTALNFIFASMAIFLINTRRLPLHHQIIFSSYISSHSKYCLKVTVIIF